MTVPWLGYVPVPGLQVVPVIVAPGDRLSRFHAWQSGALLLLWFLGLLLLGLLLGPLPDGGRQVVGLVAGLWGLAGLALMAVGLVGAARGRYTRLPGIAGLLTAMRR